MRIVGINIPDEKHLNIALTSVYGIGRARARNILKETAVDPTMKAKDLSNEQETQIRKQVESFTVEGDLRRSVDGNVKRLKDLQVLRGYRHSVGLPVRGQRTRTNARTKRQGGRKTMGSGRVKLQKK